MKKEEGYNECKSGVILDEIEFFNAGSYTNPYHGVKIKGREKEDYKTECEIRLFGIKAEEFEIGVSEELKKKIKFKKR